MEENIVMIIGIVLVLMNAFERFNTPPSNRAMTTAARYYTAASAYILIYLLAYFLLLNYQGLLNLLLRWLNLNKFDESLPAGVVGAILLSSILPKIPGFFAADQKLRKFFQNLAAIPIQALRLSREIYEAPFSVPVEFRQKVRDHLIGLGFNEADLVFEQEDSAKFLWLKNAILLLELKDWRDNGNFSEFFNDRNEQFKRLNDRYQRLTAMAQNCFNLVRDVSSRDVQNPMELSVRKFYANFKEQADDLFRELCQFTSQGILRCRLTRGSRCRNLYNMGFNFRDDARAATLSIHQFLLLYGLMVILISANFIKLFPAWDNGEKTMLMSTMIVSIYLAAAWCAVLLKDKLPGFRRKPGHFPPSGAYLVAGLVAVVAGVIISLFFKTLIFTKGELGVYDAFAKAWQHFSTESYPWMFQAFTTAIIISALADYPPPERIPEKIWRFVQAAIQGSLTLATGLFVHWWLKEILPQGADLPEVMAVCVVSAVAGMLMGFVVPSWYRKAKLKEHNLAERENAPSLAVASHG